MDVVSPVRFHFIIVNDIYSLLPVHLVILRLLFILLYGCYSVCDRRIYLHSFPRGLLRLGSGGQCLFNIPTPVNIPFGNFVGLLEIFATYSGTGKCRRALSIPDASGTILFRIDFGCGAIYMKPALLVVIDTDDYAFSRIAMHFTTMISTVLSLLSCWSSVFASASELRCNTARGSDSGVYSELIATG